MSLDSCLRVTKKQATNVSRTEAFQGVRTFLQKSIGSSLDMSSYWDDLCVVAESLAKSDQERNDIQELRGQSEFSIISPGPPDAMASPPPGSPSFGGASAKDVIAAQHLSFENQCTAKDGQDHDDGSTNNGSDDQSPSDLMDTDAKKTEKERQRALKKEAKKAKKEAKKAKKESSKKRKLENHV